MAQTKATKKFEKKHLKDTLKRRNDFKKIKQRNQLREKKKAKRAQDVSPSEQGTNGREERVPAALNAMSVDDFFAGDFEIPTRAANGKKRKRGESGDQEDESDSGDSDGNDAAMDDSSSNEDQTEQQDTLEDHQKDLKELGKKDPEFYQYLRENDAELLDFAEDSNLAEVDELSEGEQEAGAGSSSRKKVKKQEDDDDSNITAATVTKWASAMAEKKSLRAAREMVLAFRAAAHLNDENNDKDYKYTISNANVYNAVLLGALNNLPVVLNHHVPVKELPNGKIRIATESNKYRKLTSMIKSHTLSLNHLLESLSDAATLNVTLSSILELTPYMLSFKKVVRELSRTVAEIWSDSSHTEATRISAFLVLRRLTVIGDPGIKENMLRINYQALLKGSRSTTIHNLTAINLMKNSAVELWTLTADSSQSSLAYTTAFTLIRQLAIHLRNSLKAPADKKKDAYKQIYNWQYTHSLDFWSRVLSAHCTPLAAAARSKESPLHPLIYPLVQVSLGAARLLPTAAYFPLRFHVARALLRLSASTNTFIPLAPLLHEVLASAELKAAPKPSTLKPLDFDVTLRAGAAYLRTRVYQDGVGEQVAELLAEFFAVWCRCIAFPELRLPVVVMLRRWLKEVSPGGAGKGGPGKAGKKGGGGVKNTKLTSAVSLLVGKLDANARFIEERRAKVDFAPSDRAGVEGFLKEMQWDQTPLGAFVDGQRRQKEERKRMLEEGRREEEERKRGGRETDVGRTEEFGVDDDDDDEDGGSRDDFGEQEEESEDEMEDVSEEEMEEEEEE